MFKTLQTSAFVCLIILGAYACKQDKMSYKNPDLPVNERVNNLIKQMTLDEKVAQTFCLSSDWYIKNSVIDTVKIAKVLEKMKNICNFSILLEGLS